MFKVGEYIVYGSKGVCQINQIGMIGIDKNAKDRLYYTLTPVYESGSKVFTPVDNDKVIMRPVLSKEEAQHLIQTIPEVEIIHSPSDKGREEIYKEIIKECDCVQWIRMIKTIYFRKQARFVEGKKAMNTEEKYLHIAEDVLYGELAISLEIDLAQVKKMMVDRINGLDYQIE